MRRSVVVPGVLALGLATGAAGAWYFTRAETPVHDHVQQAYETPVARPESSKPAEPSFNAELYRKAEIVLTRPMYSNDSRADDLEHIFSGVKKDEIIRVLDRIQWVEPDALRNVDFQYILDVNTEKGKLDPVETIRELPDDVRTYIRQTAAPVFGNDDYFTRNFPGDWPMIYMLDPPRTYRYLGKYYFERGDFERMGEAFHALAIMTYQWGSKPTNLSGLMQYWKYYGQQMSFATSRNGMPGDSEEHTRAMTVWHRDTLKEFLEDDRYAIEDTYDEEFARRRMMFEVVKNMVSRYRCGVYDTTTAILAVAGWNEEVARNSLRGISIYEVGTGDLGPITRHMEEAGWNGRFSRDDVETALNEICLRFNPGGFHHDVAIRELYGDGQLFRELG